MSFRVLLLVSLGIVRAANIRSDVLIHCCSGERKGDAVCRMDDTAGGRCPPISVVTKKPARHLTPLSEMDHICEMEGSVGSTTECTPPNRDTDSGGDWNEQILARRGSKLFLEKSNIKTSVADSATSFDVLLRETFVQAIKKNFPASVHAAQKLTDTLALKLAKELLAPITSCLSKQCSTAGDIDAQSLFCAKELGAAMDTFYGGKKEFGVIFWNGNGVNWVAKQTAMNLAYALTESDATTAYISLEGSLWGYIFERIANPSKFQLNTEMCLTPTESSPSFLSSSFQQSSKCNVLGRWPNENPPGHGQWGYLSQWLASRTNLDLPIVSIVRSPRYASFFFTDEIPKLLEKIRARGNSAKPVELLLTWSQVGTDSKTPCNRDRNGAAVRYCEDTDAKEKGTFCKDRTCAKKCRDLPENELKGIVCGLTCRDFVHGIAKKTPMAASPEKKNRLQHVYAPGTEPGQWDATNPYLRIYCLEATFDAGAVDGTGATSEHAELSCDNPATPGDENDELWKSMCGVQPKPWLKTKIRTFRRVRTKYTVAVGSEMPMPSPADPHGADLVDSIRAGTWRNTAELVWGVASLTPPVVKKIALDTATVERVVEVGMTD